jgi:multisubunit Na+/H+ antiporter MnhE subunit
MSEDAQIPQKPNPVHLMLGIIFGLIVIFLPRALGPESRDGFLQYVFQVISLCLCVYLIGRFARSQSPKH